MPKVKFHEDHTTKCCPEDRQEFKAGKTYDMNDASARHFTIRGLAEVVDAKDTKEADHHDPVKAPAKPLVPPHHDDKK